MREVPLPPTVSTVAWAFQVAVNAQRPPLPPTEARHPMWPPQVRALVTDCWQQDPRARPTAKQVLQRLEAMLAEAGGEPDGVMEG